MFNTDLVYDGEKTWDEYYAQFPSVTPELGKTYVVHPNTWQEIFYEIIFIDDNIAVGKGRNPFDTTLTEYAMYYASGPRPGWKYKDCRPPYRLQEILK